LGSEQNKILEERLGRVFVMEYLEGYVRTLRGASSATWSLGTNTAIDSGANKTTEYLDGVDRSKCLIHTN
jgi:hypothetical protein